MSKAAMSKKMKEAASQTLFLANLCNGFSASSALNGIHIHLYHKYIVKKMATMAWPLGLPNYFEQLEDRMALSTQKGLGW